MFDSNSETGLLSAVFQEKKPVHEIKKCAAGDNGNNIAQPVRRLFSDSVFIGGTYLVFAAVALGIRRFQHCMTVGTLFGCFAVCHHILIPLLSFLKKQGHIADMPLFNTNLPKNLPE